MGRRTRALFAAGAGVAGAAVLATGCLGDNQLAGSVDSIFPLDVSTVEVRRNPEALQVSYYANHGADIDLVAELDVYIGDLDLQLNKPIPLQGEAPPGHQRTTVVHKAQLEPVRYLPNVQHGDLVIEQGGQPDQFTRGNFSMSFENNGDFGTGRNLEGTFDVTALDGGFGPNTP